MIVVMYKSQEINNIQILIITDYIDDFSIFDWVSTLKAGADRERAIDTTPKRSKLVNYGLRGGG